MKIGEFEEEAVFQKRVESAKQKSETDYAKAMDDWKVNVKSHNYQWESYVKTLPEFRKSTMDIIEDIERKIAEERKNLDSIQTVNLSTKVMMFFPYKCEQLPTFDRTTMSFPSVKLFPSGYDWNTSSANEYCRFNITGNAYRTQSLYFSTLEQAKAFKEAYERDEVSFWVVAEVRYIESKYDKVITQTAQYKTVTEEKLNSSTLFWNMLAAGVAIGVVVNGGDPGVPNLPSEWETVTRQEVVRPEKNYSGTFHHYGVKMIGTVLAVDKKGFVDIKSGK